jgi:hypothetical protein
MFQSLPLSLVSFLVFVVGVFVSVVVVIQVSIGDGAVFVFFGVGIAELLVFIKGI